jgi:hypothetical protein
LQAAEANLAKDMTQEQYLRTQQTSFRRHPTRRVRQGRREQSDAQAKVHEAVRADRASIKHEGNISADQADRVRSFNSSTAPFDHQLTAGPGMLWSSKATL